MHAAVSRPPGTSLAPRRSPEARRVDDLPFPSTAAAARAASAAWMRASFSARRSWMSRWRSSSQAAATRRRRS
eukprot:7384327-Prymnesium_polylepis.1